MAKRNHISSFTAKHTDSREAYLVKYKYTAIRWIVTYYKNSKGWPVNAFKWDSDFDEEFKYQHKTNRPNLFHYMKDSKENTHTPNPISPAKRTGFLLFGTA